MMLNGYISYLKKSKQGANEPGASLAIRDEIMPYDTQSIEDIQDFNDTAL